MANFIMCVYIYAQSLSCLRLFATPWPAAHQAPPSMGILQATIVEWLPCPPPGDLPNPGIEPRSPVLQADCVCVYIYIYCVYIYNTHIYIYVCI